MDHGALQSAYCRVTPDRRRLLHLIGGTLAIGSAIFLALQIHEHFDAIRIGDLAVADWLVIGVACIVYALANVLLAMAWRDLLAWRESFVTRSWALYAYGISQIARYVPGNVFQFVGRQAIGMGAGISGSTLVLSAMSELALIAAAGSLFVLTVALTLLISIDLPWAILATGSTATGTVWALARIFAASVSRAFQMYLVFLTLAGLVFVIVIAVLTTGAGLSTDSVVRLVVIYVAAWLAGLLVPGAPAGLGIRETVLLTAGAGIVADDILLTGALLTRLITMSGDFLFFIVAALAKPRMPVPDECR